MRPQPAQATKYIVNPLTGRRVGFAKLFTTHPPTAERVAACAGAEYDWPSGRRAAAPFEGDP